MINTLKTVFIGFTLVGMWPTTKQTPCWKVFKTDPHASMVENWHLTSIKVQILVIISVPEKPVSIFICEWGDDGENKREVRVNSELKTVSHWNYGEESDWVRSHRSECEFQYHSRHESVRFTVTNLIGEIVRTHLNLMVKGEDVRLWHNERESMSFGKINCCLLFLVFLVCKFPKIIFW